MTTSAQVAAYEHEARQISGLPDNIVYLPDNPAVTSGLQAKMGDGNPPYTDLNTGYIEGAPNYTVTKRIAIHEFGHLWHFNNRAEQDLFWAWRFGSCTTAPKTWAEAYADAHPTPGTELWVVLPGETIAECFAVAVEGMGKERTLDYGCTIDPVGALRFFGGSASSYNIEWVGPADSGNFSPGRSGNPVNLIVDHWVGAGTAEQAVAHFKAAGAQVSAHYVISTTGHIYQVVFEEDTAWHAGDFPVNQRSIGIEHEARPDLLPSAALYAASAWLHARIAAKYQFTLEVGTTVRPHHDFTATACPGTLDLARIVAEAGGEDVSPEQDQRLKNIEAAVLALQQQQTSLVTVSLPTWLQRAFFALNPITGKRQGKELTPPNLEVQ